MIVYFNGSFVPAEQARVSVFDRGFTFGDGVYEGLRTHRGSVIGLEHHVRRLRAGLAEVRMDPQGAGGRSATGFTPERMGELTSRLVEQNGLSDAFVYWQITRGAPPAGAPVRSRVPDARSTPTVFAYAVACTPVDECLVPETKSVALRPDTRWTRGHLKSTALLGGVLAALEAQEQGADDAILERGGLVTEGTSTNVVLSRGGRFITPALESAPMLAGVTRRLLIDLSGPIEERPVTTRELLEADEVMLVGTLTMVAAVVSIDGRPVGAAASRGMRAGPDAVELLARLRRAIHADLDSTHARPGVSGHGAPQPVGGSRR